MSQAAVDTVPDYHTLAARLRAGGLSDPWLEGRERFRPEPVLLSRSRYDALTAAAQAVAAVYDELAAIVAAEPVLLDDFFLLTPWQKAMWLASAPHWHGIARADVFWTDAGPQVCELNSDTPSGQAEAVLLNGVVAGPDGLDPNAQLGTRFVAMVESWARRVGALAPSTIGLVYPTEMTEDLTMVGLYRAWLSARGHRVVLGSPFNVTAAADGRAAVFGIPCDVVLRHYKTDWWGERLPLFTGESRFQDPLPLEQPLLALLAAQCAGRTTAVNPWGSVLTQNKRTLAFLHEERARFSLASQQAIARYVPRTWRLEACRERLWQQRAQFVVKSDYGCEGAEVTVGRAVSQAEWEAVLASAIPTRFVAQECFTPELDAHGEVTNFGVFVVAGQAAGMLVRVHPPGSTDVTARCAPVLVATAAARCSDA